jgi:hypothetical protein
MISFLVVVIIGMGTLVMVFAMLWDGVRLERNSVVAIADDYYRTILQLEKQVRESGLAHGRADDRHQRAEKKLAECWGLLEAEKAGRLQDGVTAQARYGQLVAERDALRRKLEVRGAEAGLMFEVMAEWLRSHGYEVKG